MGNSGKITTWVRKGLKNFVVISFLTTDLRLICEDQHVAVQQLGSDVSTRLHSRLADINAARSLEDLPVALFQLTELGETCELSTGLGNNFFLVLEPAISNQLKSHNKINRWKVKSVATR